MRNSLLEARRGTLDDSSDLAPAARDPASWARCPRPQERIGSRSCSRCRSSSRRSCERSRSPRPKVGGRPDARRDRSRVATVVAIVTGMGTELATAGTRRLLDAVPVRWVLVVGITGALENDTPIGTLVLPEIVVNSETGREFRPCAPRRRNAGGEDVDHQRAHHRVCRPRPAARRRCRVARHGDGGDRRALRSARHPVVGVPGDLRSRERRHGRRRGIPPQQSGRHARTPPRSSATSHEHPERVLCSRKWRKTRSSRRARRSTAAIEACARIP